MSNGNSPEDERPFEDVSEEEVAPGVFLPFVHRPLSRYVNTMADGEPRNNFLERTRFANGAAAWNGRRPC